MKRITVTLDVEYGSDMQEEVGTKTLNSVLTAWTLYMHNNHKKNIATFSLKEKGLKKELRVKDAVGYHTL